MTKRLIIAEKPSVAADIARALGGFNKHDDYFESEQFVLCSAIGHLLELACPEEFEVKRGKWSFANLPVIPPHFDLNPIDKTENRLKLLGRLIKRKDVISLVNACDAGREGELIFNYIASHFTNKKPVERLWLQSMTPSAIRDGFQSLIPASKVDGLRQAAICRSESDWLVGINGTRAMTAFNSKSGGFHLTTVGRVQTPTLAILVEREQKIKRFSARPYWEIESVFAVQAGEYRGKWFDEGFRRREGEADEYLRADRIWFEEKAREIAGKVLHKPGVVTEEAKPSSQLSPLLFDLTSLQREANNRFGFSAKATLGLAQALYEKHKVLTYPRTDSRALPEDYLGTVRESLGMLSGEHPGKGHDEAIVQRYAAFAQRVLSNNWVRPDKRVFNNAKISDHFAIIPTALAPKHLSEPEFKLYDLVVKRFLSVFFPPAEYLVTTRITRVDGEPFKTEGKVLVEPGWLSVYGKDPSDEDANLTPIRSVAGQPELAANTGVQVKPFETKPPARYSEATLLSAMEGAGKTVEDEELRSAMAGRGLGTPATRAQIIENLISENYVLREGRELHPTAKAFSLMTLLNGLGITELTQPELTGDWEWKLARMERGALSRDEFMKEIAAMTRHIVESAKGYEHDTIPGDFGQLAVSCPKCGAVVRETYKKFQCTACEFSLWKIVAGRQFEAHEIEALIRDKTVGPLSGFRNKMGRPFTALIKMNAEWQPEFDFGSNGNNGESGSDPVDFSQQTPLGSCPTCKGKIFDQGMAYVCENSVASVKTCNFRSGKIILQQLIEPAQMEKLLRDGRTDLLKEFVSNRTRRKFSAFLVLGADGKVGFEFEQKRKDSSKTEKSKAAPETKAGGDESKTSRSTRKKAG